MEEIRYWVAEDGKKFDYEDDCIEYERKIMLEEYKEHFKFFDYNKCPIPIEDATTEKVFYIIIKTEKGAEVVGEWFKTENCFDPFDEQYDSAIGTWYYSGNERRGDGWYHIEKDMAYLQNLFTELNQL